MPLGVATPLDLSLTTDIAITGGLLRSTGALARGIPAAASITGTAIVYDRAMRPVTEFESKHQWVDGDFNEMLDNPTIPKTDKDKMVRSMMGDPLLRSTSTTSLSTGINLNQLTLSQTLSTLTPAPKLSASSASSSSLGPVSVSPYITIDSKINRPLIETFPIVDDRPHDFVTEIPDRDLARFKPTGFDPVDKDKLPSSREEFPDHSELADSMDVFFKKQYPDSVEKINDRYPINGDYAGQDFPLPPELHGDFGESIKFKDKGFPDLTPHTKATVVSDHLKGNESDDTLANKAMGYKDTPDGMSWHHVEDGRTLQLVDKRLHEAVRHTGGRAVLKERGKR